MTTITELVPAQVSSELEDEIKTNEELANDKDEPKVSSESVVQEELNDSLDNCNFAEKSVDTEPVVVKRKPGRPPKKRPLPEEESSELNEVNDTEPVDNQDTVVAERAEPRRRGRKPKDKNGEKYVPDPKKRGIMAGSDAPLRRRDRITPLARYSPPPHQPSKRGRRGGTSFPSTSSTRYLNFTDEGAKESYVLDFKKDESSNKMLITVSDGTTYKVDATPVPAGSKGTKARNDEDEEYDVDDDGALEDVEDDEYKPTYNERRKMKKKPDSTDEPMKLPGRQAKTKKPVWKPARAGGSALSADVASDGGHRTTKITSGTTTGKTKVTIITTPKSVTLTPAFNKPNVRTYGSGTARYIDELPDISECTLDSSQKDMSRLPDAILLLKR
ncbi:hypothetical protein HDE_03690 [Halotydeus destructor]|nr:hypothetical protein HDE_03690 [Halotydeus destructor]